MLFFASCSKHDCYSVNVIIEVDDNGEFNINAVNFLVSGDTKVGSKINLVVSEGSGVDDD